MTSAMYCFGTGPRCEFCGLPLPREEDGLRVCPRKGGPPREKAVEDLEEAEA